MKFKVGNRVRVRQWEAMARQYELLSNDNIGIYKEYLYPFLKTNKKFCGQIVTIKKIENDCYRIKEDNERCCWIDEMFEGCAFQFGEVAEFSIDGKEWRKRIYVGYIDGANSPYVTVNTFDELEFRKGRSFEYAFWKYARPISKKHTIIIDGIEIKVSDEDYKALKEKLCKEK